MRETKKLHATHPILWNFTVRVTDRTKVMQPWHRYEIFRLSSSGQPTTPSFILEYFHARRYT